MVIHHVSTTVLTTHVCSLEQHLWCNHGDSEERWAEPWMAMTKSSGQTDTPHLLGLYTVTCTVQ